MDQAELLRRVIEILEQLDLTYMVVGSVASGAYGEPRLTRDIDIVVRLPAEQVSGLCQAFGPPDYYVDSNAAMQAALACGQFNVIHPASGNKVDFVIARNDPWGRMQIHRRRRVRILPDLEGYAAAPEDIILGKMDYYRQGGSEKHARDVAGMIKVSGELIDRAYVAEWAERLGLSETWRAVLSRLAEEA